MPAVQIGSQTVGDGHPCFVIAEIGINHNGDVAQAKRLISVAAAAGCSAVKFQKRTVDVVYSPAGAGEAARESVRRDERRSQARPGARFEQYSEIDRYASASDMPWFASCWDEASVDFIDQFDPPCYKIASASLTDDRLLRYTRSKGKPIILSTGMSTLEQIDHAVGLLGTTDLILLHTCSTYPSQYPELNLRVILTLRERYGVPVGYSGHETGLPSSVAAAALGACWSSGTSPPIDRCGAPITRHRSSRTGSTASCATSGWSRPRWAMASSASCRAKCR